MALSDFVLALFILMGTLLISFAVVHQMLSLKRRAIRVTAPAAAYRRERR